MVSDKQVKYLRRLLQMRISHEKAAFKSGMSEKTARKYRDSDQMPSQSRKRRDWNTRENPFDEVWDEIEPYLEENPGVEAITLFNHLQRIYPGRFQDGQLRTFQRRVKNWRATKGKAKEIFFPQVHKPGKLGESDFTDATKLGVTINKQLLKHKLYHFTLTYSNWEYVRICDSETYESLSAGLQGALWTLGAAPKYHRTDRLTAAVRNLSSGKEFTDRYEGLLNHYRITGEKIEARKPNQNGDVEQSHYRFLTAIDQALMLRGHRDFSSVKEYEFFLKMVMDQRNAGRTTRLKEEYQHLKELPQKKLDDAKILPEVSVSKNSTIRVQDNIYSVHSRLIEEKVYVIIRADLIEVWYGQKKMETIPRLRGEKKHRINYRHVIPWLIRKPGAFENYKYKKDLFPRSSFRMAYDLLSKQFSRKKATKHYLEILKLAADISEDLVDYVIWKLLQNDEALSYEKIKAAVDSTNLTEKNYDVKVEDVNLIEYDKLINLKEIRNENTA